MVNPMVAIRVIGAGGKQQAKVWISLSETPPRCHVQEI
jgi:hypothetical protein